MLLPVAGPPDFEPKVDSEPVANRLAKGMVQRMATEMVNWSEYCLAHRLERKMVPPLGENSAIEMVMYSVTL